MGSFLCTCWMGRDEMDIIGESFDAWTAWIDGRRSTATLWGVSFLWWERIGKLLMFFAGLTIVLDLVGPDPFERFGRRMSSWTLQKAHAIFAGTFGVLQVVGLVIGALMFFAAYNALWGVIFQAGRKRGDLPDFAYSPLFVLAAVVVWVVLSVIGASADEHFDSFGEHHRQGGWFDAAFYYIFWAPRHPSRGGNSSCHQCSIWDTFVSVHRIGEVPRLASPSKESY